MLKMRKKIEVSPPSVRPETQADLASAADGNEMNRFNLDRHGSRVNALFVDTSVKVVTLREFWGLKWHKSYESGQETARVEAAGWPDWMKK